MDQNSSSEIERSDVYRSFAEYSSDEISAEISFSGVKYSNPRDDMICQVLTHRAKHNTSYAAASSFAETLNSVPGAKLKIPTRKDDLKNEVKLLYEFEQYIFCSSCNLLCKVDTDCSTCNRRTKKTKDNYFIFIPVKQQIVATLRKYAGIIFEFLSQERNGDVLFDVFDGNIYIEEKAKCSEYILLPLTLNLDGGKIFSSSKSTLWPIQLVQNYLPPNMRFDHKHIILAGLYCGKTKPDISTIMVPLALEMNSIDKKGISIWHQNKLSHFKPAILFCACDLPARCDVQAVKHSGYYSCPVCKQRGEAVKNNSNGKSYVRFLKTTEEPPKRTHTDAKRIMMKIVEGNGNEIELNCSCGIKGLSSMIAFKHFDLANGFVIDWMHGVLLGVLPLLLDYWLGVRTIIHGGDEQPICIKMLNTKERAILNGRIVSLKPPSRINHKPRSISERAFYTANEYRSLLWFYLRFALKGLLDERLIAHFELLSNATYVLSKRELKRTEITEAGAMLNQFVDQFELYYGKNSVTINVHILRHYTDSVLNSGQLWCNSLFSFESNMGYIKSLFCSNVDVVQQIAYNYCIQRTIEFNDKKEKSISLKLTQVLRPKKRVIANELCQILHASGLRLSPMDEMYAVSYEMSWKSELLKSVSSSSTRSADYFIELQDGTLGAIECFIHYNGIDYVLLRQYELVKSNFHLKQVQQNRIDKYLVAKCEVIKRKLIYLKYDYSRVGYIEIVCIEPNFVEGN